MKTTLDIDILHGKTPEIVRKEIYAHLLAYNLLRTVMWEAGTTHNVDPLRLSLQGTRQLFDNFIPQLASASTQKPARLFQTLPFNRENAPTITVSDSEMFSGG